MLQSELNKIYKNLKRGATVDITAFAKEEYKEYTDTPNGEKLITKMTLQMRGKQQPVIIAERFRDNCLVENHWYYLDQLISLKSLLDSWLNKI